MTELKNLVYKSTEGDNEVYGRPSPYLDLSANRIYQRFVPYDAGNSRYNDVENEVYYYQNNDVKRGKEIK